MGTLGDVGVHILDYVTHIAGSDTKRVSCKLTTFDKAAGGKIGAYTLDANDSFNMHLQLCVRPFQRFIIEDLRHKRRA